MKQILTILLSLQLFLTYSIQALEQRPLNILFVVEYFPAPSQTFILNIMTGLIDRGHNVSIFSYRTSKDQKLPGMEKYSLLDRVTYSQFPVDMLDCDIVFCQSASLGKKIFENSVVAEWVKNRKMVVALRGHDITKNEAKDDPSMYQKLFEMSDLFLPVCYYFKDVAVQLGCDPSKIIVYHSAIDCSRFFFKEKKVKKNEKIELVSVCRLVEKKGLDIAIKAVAEVVKKNKNIRFTIIGRGRLRSELEKLVKKLGIENKVNFFGWAIQDQVIKILDKSHIFLLPSITAANGDEEGIANALKEAMAMGLMSIGTVHAGTPELIDDEVSGFLVPQNDSKALAEKIMYVVQHPEIWKKTGLAARQKIEAEFEIKKSIKQLEKIFYTLLART